MSYREDNGYYCGEELMMQHEKNLMINSLMNEDLKYIISQINIVLKKERNLDNTYISLVRSIKKYFDERGYLSEKQKYVLCRHLIEYIKIGE